MLFDCFGATFLPHLIFEKSQTCKTEKSWENRTNMDIILLFLAKPLDKHGTTPVHITYLPFVTSATKQTNYPGEPKLTMMLPFPQKS